jgi:hypothetical protein
MNIYNYYSTDFSVIKIKEDEMCGTCSTHERDEKYKQYGKPEGKRPFGKPRHKQEYDIRMEWNLGN